MVKNNPLKPDFICKEIKFEQASRIGMVLLGLILLLTLSGCVTFNDPEASQEFNTDTVAILDAQSTIGQTFISRRPHLNGIMIWVSLPSASGGEPSAGASKSIRVELFRSDKDTEPVFSSTLLLPISGSNIPFSINLPVQDNLPGESYYLKLSTVADPILINGRNEDAYPHGQADVDGKFINADIAFRLSYDYDIYGLGQDIQRGFKQILLIFPLMAVLLLPGWLLLDISGLSRRYDGGELIAISTGLSLAIIPLLMLWTSMLKLRWTKSGLLIVFGLLFLLFLLRLLYKSGIRKNKPANDSANQLDGNLSSPEQMAKYKLGIFLVLLAVFILTLSLRFIMVRDLATPAWVDSVHHALFTRLILVTGAYPSNFLPYLDIPTTAYHLGFHSTAATFTWLSNLDIDRALLILGQVLNALFVFSVYLFTKTLVQSVPAALVAATITGFLTPMPAYYTSWGRYTELTGLIILPAAFSFIYSLKDETENRQKRWFIILAAFASAGLFMVHYRVIVFLGALILAYGLTYSFTRIRGRSGRLLQFMLLILIIAVISILLVFPWMIQTIKNTVLPFFDVTGVSSTPFFQDFSWAYLTAALGKQSLVLAGLGLTWGVIKGKRFAFLLLIWIFLLFLTSNLDALGIPGGGLVSTSSVEIMLFIPISVLGGYFVDRIIVHWADFVPKQLFRLYQVGLVFLMGLVSLIGARQLVIILNPITILSREQDLPAIRWIGENIAENETIVINPFAWGYGNYAGADGGYWISPLSGRVTLPPPVLYGLGSARDPINDQIQQIISLNPDPLAFRDYLQAHQIKYIYIGAKGGIISPAKLASSGLFSTLYHKGSVWIFGLKP